jgi:hypothetical protein
LAADGVRLSAFAVSGARLMDRISARRNNDAHEQLLALTLEWLVSHGELDCQTASNIFQ